MVGKFITFEGGEGAGKSTQARRLADRLMAAGIEVVVTREPGGTPFAERIRDLVLAADTPRAVLAEALLFAAARADHVERLIRPAIARGAWVLSDRFADSTRAYQGAAGGLSPSVVSQLETIAVGTTQPNLTLVLDLPVAAGLARARVRRDLNAEATDAFEARTVVFHERLRQGFLAIAAAEPERCIVVDAENSIDEIADRVRQVVTRQFDVDLS